MHLDLLTLYLLTIGTLFLSAAMTLWERHARPQRRRELTMLAGGYATMASGCIVASHRSALPGMTGAAIANIVILAGYLLVLNGVAALNGRSRARASFALLGLSVLMWAVGGTAWREVLWAHVSAIPIAVVSGATAWEMWRAGKLRSLRSRPIVGIVTGMHGVFYAMRATVLPLLAGFGGPAVLAIASKLTMYEAVLYSVGMPMALLALIREEAHEQLLAVARTDYLTGLANRQWFFEESARAIGSGRGERQRVAILAFDLDHFKAINDRHGHAAGDEVLKSFADIAGAMMPAGALLARIGGEEFSALLPGHDAARARAIGEAIARRFAATAAHGEQGVRMSVTVSIGVAQVGPNVRDFPALMAMADRALYFAKARGRDRVEIALPDEVLACA